MTREQFEDVKNKLAKWREERRLSVEEQRKNFNVNFTEELTEFFKAQRDGNEYEMIDALCDMLVVGINAGHILGFAFGEFYNDESTEFKLTSPFIYEDSLHLIALEIRQMGYDPYKCLLETIKKLESRTGRWNEKEGKWIKDLGAYTLEEALKNAERVLECGFVLKVKLLKEDNDFWLIGDDDEEEVDEELSLDELKDEFYGACIKIKKWYMADYIKCKDV